MESPEPTPASEEPIRRYTLDDVLARIRSAASSESDKGTRFELLVKYILENEPTLKDYYSNVWMWSEWPDNGGEHDVGVDLVARVATTGEYCAIQCKCYQSSSQMSLKRTSTFFQCLPREWGTAQAPVHFSTGTIFCTVDEMTKHLQNSIKKTKKTPCTFIGLSKLKELTVAIDWDDFYRTGITRLRPKFQSRPHQKEAIAAAINGFKEADRGQLIMACGTGKTFTSLRLAEEYTGGKGSVLFCVPSLALLAQTLQEWMWQAESHMHAIAICSDTTAARIHKIKDIDNDGDLDEIMDSNLPFEPTTNAEELARQYRHWRNQDAMEGRESLTVFFCTYHSIDVITKAQAKRAIPEFDLAICDEAHRTTGVVVLTEKAKGERPVAKKATTAETREFEPTLSHFVKVHDNRYVRTRKRLYMTATPRIFSESSKTKAKRMNAEADSPLLVGDIPKQANRKILLRSMDDPAIFGKEFYRLSFSMAVRKDLLSDYRVLILTIEESHVKAFLQTKPSDGESQLELDDAVKLLGCYNGLIKKIDTPRFATLCKPEEGVRSYGEEELAAADTTGESKKEENPFQDDPNPMRRAVAFTNSIAHSKSLCREMAQLMERLRIDDEWHEDWEEKRPEAVIDHVDGSMSADKRAKKLGWLKEEHSGDECRILSNARCLTEGIDVPALDAIMFLSPRKSMVDIIQAVGRVMRKAGKEKKYGYIILPVGVPEGKDPNDVLDNNEKYQYIWKVLQALRAHDDRFNDEINRLESGRSSRLIVGGGDHTPTPTPGPGMPEPVEPTPETPLLPGLRTEEWRDAILAKIVEKCGTRHYWLSWAKDIAGIAKRQKDAIGEFIQQPAIKPKFDAFLSGLHDNINPNITEDEAVEMLAQQAITRPIFDTLFGGAESFAQRNPVSKSMREMLNLVLELTSEEDSKKLEEFFEDVKVRVKGLDNDVGRQKVIRELYDSFFKEAFAEMSRELGIVYTPEEIVDFIVHSVHYVLQKEFGKKEGLAAPGVRILDPFTGTGTFIVRLIQSGLIPKEKLTAKYRNDLFASEIVLMAYYIACINIEDAYHRVVGGEYETFQGICLTDTFLMDTHKGQGTLSTVFADNAERVHRITEKPIQVIFGNPPYSVSKKKTDYADLDNRIRETYVERMTEDVQNKNSLYDSYIRAFRWSSDQLKDEGVLAFVTNGSFIDKTAMSGFRQSLLAEFAKVYCLNLRGAIRAKSKLDAKKEGGNVFNIMTGVCVTVLVKKKGHVGPGTLYYHDIGDYLSQKEKLEEIRKSKSIEGMDWNVLTPDEHGDWINHRDPGFDKFLPIGDKETKGKGTSAAVFNDFSRGVESDRDAWVYNYLKDLLAENMKRCIDFYNTQLGKKELENDASSISWSRAARKRAAKGDEKAVFRENSFREAVYRPFCKLWLYFDKDWVDYACKQPKFFPTSIHKNLVICIPSPGSRQSFTCFISDQLPDLHVYSDGAQCFPLYWYERNDDSDNVLGLDLDVLQGDYIQQDGITDWAWKEFTKAYGDTTITKQDIFFYVYGVLHSPEYAQRFEANLKKELPRIPFAKDFRAFEKAGRELAKLHLHYEEVEPWPEIVEVGSGDLRVAKMSFDKKTVDGKSVNDRSVIFYNSSIKLTRIPEVAYDYIVNGKSALEWVMERYAVKTDKESGIVNDPNDWCEETGNPRYIIDLVKRVVTVSVRTVEIVNDLPPLDELN